MAAHSRSRSTWLGMGVMKTTLPQSVTGAYVCDKIQILKCGVKLCQVYGDPSDITTLDPTCGDGERERFVVVYQVCD